jgi:hypothetical protein
VSRQELEHRRELERELHRAELRAVRDALRPGTSEPPRAEPTAEADLPDPLAAEVWALAARTRMLESQLRRAVIAGVGVGLAALALGGLALGLAFLLAGAPASDAPTNEFAELSVGRLSLRGGLELVDESGRRLAFLGREPGAFGSSAPVALGLYDGHDGQAVRIAASPGGAALSLAAPGGTRSVSIVAFPTGAQLDVRDGERGTVLSADGARTGAGAGETGAQTTR